MAFSSGVQVTVACGGGVDTKLYLNNILDDNKLRALITIIAIAVYMYHDRDDVIIIIIMS